MLIRTVSSANWKRGWWIPRTTESNQFEWLSPPYITDPLQLWETKMTIEGLLVEDPVSTRFRSKTVINQRWHWTRIDAVTNLTYPIPIKPYMLQHEYQIIPRHRVVRCLKIPLKSIPSPFLCFAMSTVSLATTIP